MLNPRAQDNDRKLGDLTGASSQDKIEVWSRTAEDGSAILELVEYSWGSGIGWYVQKRVRMDGGQVETLKAVLEFVSPAPAPALRPRPRVVQDGNIIQLLFPR